MHLHIIICCLSLWERNTWFGSTRVALFCISPNWFPNGENISSQIWPTLDWIHMLCTIYTHFVCISFDWIMKIHIIYILYTSAASYDVHHNDNNGGQTKKGNNDELVYQWSNTAFFIMIIITMIINMIIIIWREFAHLKLNSGRNIWTKPALHLLLN